MEYREGYAAQLHNAVAFLNRARVDRQDLRPANIFWRVEGNQLKLKVFDFEDAVMFGEQISSERVLHICEVEDKRYPFTYSHNGELPQFGCARNNFYFRNFIRRWLDHEAASFGNFISAAAISQNLVGQFMNYIQIRMIMKIMECRQL